MELHRLRTSQVSVAQLYIITQLHILVKGRALRRLAVCATIKPAAPGFCGAFWTPKRRVSA